MKETKSGLVFPSTLPEALLRVSKELGEDCLILSPGVGVQGGTAFYDLKNVIYSASRSIIFSEDPIKSFTSIKNNLCRTEVNAYRQHEAAAWTANNIYACHTMRKSAPPSPLVILAFSFIQKSEEKLIT